MLLVCTPMEPPSIRRAETQGRLTVRGHRTRGPRRRITVYTATMHHAAHHTTVYTAAHGDHAPCHGKTHANKGRTAEQQNREQQRHSSVHGDEQQRHSRDTASCTVYGSTYTVQQWAEHAVDQCRHQTSQRNGHDPTASRGQCHTHHTCRWCRMSVGGGVGHNWEIPHGFGLGNNTVCCRCSLALCNIRRASSRLCRVADGMCVRPVSVSVSTPYAVSASLRVSVSACACIWGSRVRARG